MMSKEQKVWIVVLCNKDIIVDTKFAIMELNYTYVIHFVSTILQKAISFFYNLQYYKCILQTKKSMQIESHGF